MQKRKTVIDLVIQTNKDWYDYEKVEQVPGVMHQYYIPYILQTLQLPFSTWR
jgi:hypothetical protein